MINNPNYINTNILHNDNINLRLFYNKNLNNNELNILKHYFNKNKIKIININIHYNFVNLYGHTQYFSNIFKINFHKYIEIESNKNNFYNADSFPKIPNELNFINKISFFGLHNFDLLVKKKNIKNINNINNIEQIYPRPENPVWFPPSMANNYNFPKINYSNPKQNMFIISMV